MPCVGNESPGQPALSLNGLVESLEHVSCNVKKNVPSDICAQRRFRSACAFVQSLQNLTGCILDSKACKFLHADNEDSD